MSSDPNQETPRKQPIRGYEILDRIGSGGMGTIYKARQISMNRIVALKVLKKSELKDALPLDRLRREALLIARMDHPNIVKGIDMGETGRYYFFAMDFIEGRSVKSILDLHGVMDELRAASIIREVVRALHYAHQQKLTHRDIKPGNILISSTGQTKLTDLGLAKGESDLTITREGTTVGTPQYIAPEQARNPNAADIRSDIYSLGATFYHMVTGRMPFEGDTMAEVLTKVLFSRPPLPEAVRPGVSHGTSRVISRMMAKDPRRRYQTPGELMDDLDVLIEALRDGSRELANLIGMTWKDSQRARIPRMRTIVIATCGALLVMISLFFVFKSDGSEASKSSSDPDAPLRALIASYDGSETGAGTVLDRMAFLPQGIDPGRLEAFRSRIQGEIRQIMSEILSPDSSRFDRALAEGGFANAPARYRRIAAGDALDALGEHPARLPAGMQAIWKEKVNVAVTFLAKRIEEERTILLDQATLKVGADADAVRDRIEEGKLREAWEGLSGIRETSASYLEEAARGFGKQLAAVPGVDEVDWSLFLEPEGKRLFRARVDNMEKALKAEISLAFRSASEEHLKDVNEEAMNLIQGGDLFLMEKGLDGIIARAVVQAPSKPVAVPSDLNLDLPGPGVLRKILKPSYEARMTLLSKEQKDRFREGLLGRIDEYIERGNFTTALKAVQAAGKEPGAEPAYLKEWVRKLEILGSLDKAALDGLNDWKGIRTEFRTAKGGRYQGAVHSIDRASGTVLLELESGQAYKVNIADLLVEDIIAWIQKARSIEPWCKGLYAYSRGALDLAAGYLEGVEDFEDSAWYLERIGYRVNQAALARETRDQELKEDLADVDRILVQGDWREGDRLLRAVTKKYGSALPRARTKTLRESIAVMQRREEEQQRIKSLFTVPVEIAEDGAIRVVYSFDSRNELKDFDAVGQNWSVMEGRLWCGSGQTEQGVDFFHNTVGIRFGKALDPAAPIRLAFVYQPPVEGKCPCFMGISFFGRCVGIRSFPGTSHEGQINAWAGDLDSYDDYFFFPDLGEDRPKKGKYQSFGFQRGERYEIEFLWSPGRELLFKVDGKDIYRQAAFKPDEEGMEIKTLKHATIESLTMEGKLKGN